MRRRYWASKMFFKLIQTRAFERAMVRYSPHGERTFFDPNDFPWISGLEKNWRVIRKELEGILPFRGLLPNFQDISPNQYSLSADDRWKTFFLYGFGKYQSSHNCELCPETTKLVEAVPGMQTAFFSILGPGKHILPHRGLYKGVLRYHLGLMVPEPKSACRIQVGNDTACWEEGKSLVFDDCHIHQVWNETSGERVILFMDVIRPFRFPMSVVNQFLMRLGRLTSFVQRAQHNQEVWDRRISQLRSKP